METNICKLWPNLSRTIEIALLGGYKINPYYTKEDYPDCPKDFEMIKSEVEKYTNFNSIFGGNAQISIEIGMPSPTLITDNRRGYETLADVLKRVEIAKLNVLPSPEIDNSGNVVLKTAIDRVGLLSVARIETIKNLARTIAQLDNSQKIKCEHVAEAIQYNLPMIDLTSLISNKFSINGVDVVIPANISKGDLMNVIAGLNDIIETLQ